MADRETLDYIKDFERRMLAAQAELAAKVDKLAGEVAAIRGQVKPVADEAACDHKFDDECPRCIRRIFGKRGSCVFHDNIYSAHCTMCRTLNGQG